MVVRTTLPFSDYLALPEDDPWMYEMIWGDLYMSPQARFIHQRVQARLVRLLDEVAVRLVPPLVVELLSSGTAERDRGTKPRWYTDLGVREYWLLDIDRRAVEVIDLWAGTSQQSDPVRSAVLAGLTLPLARIFG